MSSVAQTSKAARPSEHPTPERLDAFISRHQLLSTVKVSIAEANESSRMTSFVLIQFLLGLRSPTPAIDCAKAKTFPKSKTPKQHYLHLFWLSVDHKEGVALGAWLAHALSLDERRWK
jgi:hypothetical protein